MKRKYFYKKIIMKTEVKEFKDKKGGNRIRVTASENGKILSSSSQGYSNKSEMIKSAVRAAWAIINKYDSHDE